MLTIHTTAAKLFAECIGVFTLCAAGIGTGLAVAQATDSAAAGLIAIALAHGLAIAVMVTAVGHISGGHLNPAVTIATLVTGHKPLGESLTYVSAQIAGAIAGAGLVRYLYPGGRGAAAIATPHRIAGTAAWKGVMLEAVMTFLLVWVVYAVALDRDGTWFRVAGLPIGFTVAAMVLMGGAVTGAAINPARSFGPALVFGSWTDWWVYWVGPIAGGAAAGLAYVTLNHPRRHEAPQA